MMTGLKLTEFGEILASSEPVPGGGGASAVVGAFAAALGRMVANLTIGKKKYVEVEEEIKEVNQKLEILQQELMVFVERDAEAFLPLSKAYRLPKDSDEEKAYKAKVMEQALYEASVVPLQMMETILKVMKLLDTLGEKGSKLAISDVGVGILFGEAALKGASLNVLINAGMMKNEDKAYELRCVVNQMITEGQELKEKVYGSVLQKIE